MAAGDHLDVDFVVGAPDRGADEDLPEARPSGSRRNRVLIGLAVLVLLVAGLSARALTSGGGAGPVAARSTPARSATPVAPAPAVTSAPVAPVDLAACPEAGDGESSCSRDDSLSRTVRTAVRAHFPGAVIVSGYTEQLRDTGYGPGGLWYRQVRASVGPLTIVVVVHRRQISDRNAPVNGSDNGTSSAVSVVRVAALLTVEVRTSGRSGLAPEFAAATALADDQRLRTL